MLKDIENSITQSIFNESPVRDRVHNEMLKVEPERMSALLLEICKLAGRTRIYKVQ